MIKNHDGSAYSMQVQCNTCMNAFLISQGMFSPSFDQDKLPAFCPMCGNKSLQEYENTSLIWELVADILTKDFNFKNPMEASRAKSLYDLWSEVRKESKQFSTWIGEMLHA